MNNRPIGVFDSGVGGLTVVKAISEVLPGESVVYIGDTARVPWGTRGKNIIKTFSRQLADFLARQEVKVIVIACHTASSIALSDLRKRHKIPVIGMIGPCIKLTSLATRNSRVGLIGTPATVKSEAWQAAIKKQNAKISVFSNACPLLVPIIEEGLANHQVAKIMAKEYVLPLAKKKIDTLILACTHYPLMEKVFAQAVPGVTLINPGREAAIYLKKYLKKNDLLAKNGKAAHRFYFTDQKYYSINDFLKHFKKLGRVRVQEVDPSKLY